LAPGAGAFAGRPGAFAACTCAFAIDLGADAPRDVEARRAPNAQGLPVNRESQLVLPPGVYGAEIPFSAT